MAFLIGPGAAIVKGQNAYYNEIGVPTFSNMVPVENGNINLASGDLHIEIPVGGAIPQRGGGAFQAVSEAETLGTLRNRCRSLRPG